MQTYPPNLASPRRGQFWISIWGLQDKNDCASSRWSSLGLVSCELRRWICSRRGNGVNEFSVSVNEFSAVHGQVAAVRGMAAGSSCADRRRLRAEARTRPVVLTQLVWTSSQLQKSLLCILCEAKVRPPAAQVYRRRLGAESAYPSGGYARESARAMMRTVGPCTKPEKSVKNAVFRHLIVL